MKQAIENSRWLGLARLQRGWCYLQVTGFEPHLWPVEFFADNKVSPLNPKTCAMCFNNLAPSYQKHMSSTNQKMTMAPEQKHNS